MQEDDPRAVLRVERDSMVKTQVGIIQSILGQSRRASSQPDLSEPWQAHWLVFGMASFLACPCLSLAGPDLVIRNLRSNPDPVFAGHPYTLYTRVLNQGDTTASAGLFQSEQVNSHLNCSSTESTSFEGVGFSRVVAASLIARTK